jgi:outer membrane immunogenic protein
MNKLLATAAAIAAIATIGSAGAADLPVKAPPMVAPAPMGWTGCWVSGGVGYGLWNQYHYGEDAVSHAPFTPTVNTAGEGWLGRAGVGCDYQVTPSFVIGAFADYDFMSLKGTFQDSVSGLVGTEKQTAAWAVGGRVGYIPLPGLLTFVSAGYTQARFDGISLSTDTVPSFPTPFTIASNTYNGWFVGGGTEYALSWFPARGLFWKTEYRYASYRAADILIQPVAITGTAENMQKNVQTVTTSLVWRFNWGGPVVARY